MQSFAIRKSVTITRKNRRERGFALITMAVTAIALVGILGLAVDVGRMFIAKNETQAYCDAAALAAALVLDGTTTGIANAKSAVTNSTNTWNLDTTAVSSPTVTFATTLAGPWVASPNPATAYIYVKVAATVSEQLYFLPLVISQTSQNVISSATAGQIDITTFPEGLAPYTAVSTNPTGPEFGLVVGNSYDISWPNFNGTKFVSPPCTGDTPASTNAVLSAWGSANSGYWGSTSNSTIEQEVVDLNSQLESVSVGTNIFSVLTNGNKASQAGYLDERASQDVDTTDNTVGTPATANTYLGSVHNGRRLLPVPIVDPVDPTHTNVIGYGQFLLLANGPGTSDYYKKNTNGNDPFCAIYAGPYTVGTAGPGVGNSTGASIVKLVQ